MTVPQVRYLFGEECASETSVYCKFNIDEDTGIITAAEDYSTEDGVLEYVLVVVAEDGAPSAINNDGLPNRRKLTCHILVYRLFLIEFLCRCLNYLLLHIKIIKF